MKVNPPFFSFLLKAVFNATLYHYHKWKSSIDGWPYIDSNHKNRHNANKTMLLSSSCIPLAYCSLWLTKDEPSLKSSSKGKPDPS